MTLDSWVRSVKAWCALTGIHKRDVGASAWLQAGFNLRSWVVECVSSVDRKIKGVWPLDLVSAYTSMEQLAGPESGI